VDVAVVKAADLYAARKMGGSQADTIVDVNPVATVLPMRLNCGAKLLVREKEASASGSRSPLPCDLGGGVHFDGIQEEAVASLMGSRRRRLLPCSNLKIGGGKREKRTKAATADHDEVEKESDSLKEGKVLP
jgi:hypothetical protein